MVRLLVACALMAICVTIHAGGITWALRAMRRRGTPPRGFWRTTRLFVVVAIWIVLLHLLEIGTWAVAFFWRGAITDFHAALYFSAETYTTTGFGDVLLPSPWRLEGGIEALTGILMCGWSTGFFIAIVNRFYGSPTWETES